VTLAFASTNRNLSIASNVPATLASGKTPLFSEVRAYSRIGSETPPLKCVCAPTSLKVTLGVSWFTQSAVRFAERLTLSVSVDSTAIDGTTRTVCASAIGIPVPSPMARTRSVRRRPRASGGPHRYDDLCAGRLHAHPTNPALGRLVVRVVAIIGAHVGPACLVEYHHHDFAALDRCERLIHRVLRRGVGRHHHDDLPHVRREHACFGRGEQRRRIEDDDAVLIPGSDFAQEARHLLTRQQLGRAAVTRSRRQDRQLLHVGTYQGVPEVEVVALQQIEQTRPM